MKKLFTYLKVYVFALLAWVKKMFKKEANQEVTLFV